jgi:predicted transcriptional regulator
VRPGFRDATCTRNVVLRMGEEFIEALDELCEVNKRSRREIVEILVSEASVELQEDPDARIQPL